MPWRTTGNPSVVDEQDVSYYVVPGSVTQAISYSSTSDLDITLLPEQRMMVWMKYMFINKRFTADTRRVTLVDIA